jgi:hypothetical protein
MALTTDNKASRLFKALMGVSETKTIRDFFEEPIRSAPAVLPTQVWQYGAWVPTGSPDDLAGPNAIQAIQAMVTDQQVYSVSVDADTTVPLVLRWIKCQFTMVDAGTNNAFQLLDSHGASIQDIIPFNFGDGVSYNYNLYKSDGSTPIAFGIGDWVFDPNSGVLTFYNVQNVTGVDATHPPVMSFYQYIGGKGIPSSVAGYDGVILSIPGYNGGAGTTTWSDSTLDNAVILATNQLQQDFLTLHGWIGSDTSEGVAVAFQKLIPLVYSHTKDVVATGAGADAAEVMTLMARRGITSNLSAISGFIVDFASQGTPLGASLVKVSYVASSNGLKLSFDTGNTWGPTVTGVNTLAVGQAVKVKNGSDFVIVRRVSGPVPSQDTTDTLTLVDSITKVTLLSWNADAGDFLPYVNTDASSLFDFGFPAVTKLGKIPPSLKLGQTSSGGYSDVITPEYYGTRPTTVIVAVQDTISANSTINSSGADYIVTNALGGFFGDVLTQIYGGNSNFVGEIILRQGRYLFNSDITLSGVAGLKIKGEAPEAVILDANGATRTINVNQTASENDVFFYDMTFAGTFNISTATSGTVPAMVFLRNIIGPSVSVNIADYCGMSIVECGSLSALTIIGSNATVRRSCESSSIGTVNLNGTGTTLHGCVINTLVGHATLGINNAIAACQINTITSLNEANQYIGNIVTSYSSGVSDKFKMLPTKFEIIDSDGTRRWTGFAGPIVWDNIAKQIKLSYDTSVFSLNYNGELTVAIDASLVTFNNIGVVRADGTSVDATTVQDALADLYLNKADLDGTGKVNINQLPPSVTGGAGMVYKGMWEFDAHSGAYPTASDLGGTTLDPGWFVVVSASSVSGNPVSGQIAVLQTGESTPITFTAGDWAIYNGTIWEKVDNSFADPSYTILPTTPPDGSWTDGLLPLGGTTIVDATDQINEILLKLAPPKPVNLSTMSLVFKGVSSYTAAEAGSGTVRSAVVASTQPDATTPLGTDSITTLFYDGDSGTLTAKIDSVSVGARVLTSASDVGIYTSLNITADNDPWAGVSGKANFWKGLRAEIDPTIALSLGAHNYVLTHSISGSTPTFNFYVDDPAGTMSITGASITTSPSMSTYLSGVPSVAPSSSFILSAFTATGVVGQFYNSTEVAAITNNVGAAAVACAASSVPTLPTAGLYDDAACASKTVQMPSSAYNENISFTLTPYNSQGTPGTPSTLASGYRIDTTTESERKGSGDPTALYPAISTSLGGCGAAYNSTWSLVDVYPGELQKINNHYIWPINTSYASYIGSLGPGPDYTSLPGATIAGKSDTWRWVTYKFTSEVSNNSAFTLTFTSPVGFTADTNQITANMLIYVKVVGTSGTGWLNANAAYSGAGTPALDGDAAMVAGSSDASTKRVTFGPVVRTGDLYVRIAINSSAGVRFNGVTIGSLA